MLNSCRSPKAQIALAVTVPRSHNDHWQKVADSIPPVSENLKLLQGLMEGRGHGQPKKPHGLEVEFTPATTD